LVILPFVKSFLIKKEKTEVYGFGSDNLDISVFDDLPVYIKFRVLREGKPLLVKDIEFLNRTKFKTLQEYLDFKPAINRFCMETLKCTI